MRLEIVACQGVVAQAGFAASRPIGSYWRFGQSRILRYLNRWIASMRTALPGQKPRSCGPSGGDELPYVVWNASQVRRHLRFYRFQAGRHPTDASHNRAFWPACADFVDTGRFCFRVPHRFYHDPAKAPPRPEGRNGARGAALESAGFLQIPAHLVSGVD